MVGKISKSAKIEAGNDEKLCFSGWQVASLAGGRSLRLQGLGQLRKNFGSVFHG